MSVRGFPFLRRWLNETVSGRIGLVGRLRGEGKRREAFALAVRSAAEVLERKGYLAVMNGWNFWSFVASAADVAETSEERHHVLELIGRAPEPGGLYEASTLERVFRWRWSAGNAAGAVETAREAVVADPTSPWEYLTLAFYLLHSKLGDPLPVLADAVRADPAISPEIEKRFGAETAASVRAILNDTGAR